MNRIKINMETLIERKFQTYDYISERMAGFYLAGKLTTAEYTELDALAREQYGVPAPEEVPAEQPAETEVTA